MSGPAQVQSVEAIEIFRGALAQFEQRAQDALELLSGELRRALDWLEHERPSYWKEQNRIAGDEIHQAKRDLQRCLAFPVADERPSCREERAILKRSQVRLEQCREKSERVRYWKRQLHHELLEYEGRIGSLQRLLEIELPAARAKLQQIVRRLDAYQIERPPAPTAPVEGEE
ncbi:MAG: hypothetical protein GXP28_00600 [Planctomycetes bacterium]|nr:hypothetical protein [Planctomycetota bacterium]